MSNQENPTNSNVTRQQQQSSAGNSPMQGPTTETAHAQPADISKAEASAGMRGPVQANPAVNAGQEDPKAGKATTALENAKPRDVDVSNDASMDSTVDADGKAQEAYNDLPLDRDHVIGSNASLVNSVPAPPSGLGGIDSRAGGNLPLIATRPGWKAHYVGAVQEVNPWRQLEIDHARAGQGYEDPAPENWARVAHVIRLVQEH